MGRPKSSSQPAKPQAKWTEAQTHTLLNSLLDLSHDNDRSNNNFPPTVWGKAVKELNDTHEIDRDITQEKNHYGTLKRHYGLMRELKEGSGLGWSVEKDTVDGDEEFWAGWVAGHKGSHIFKDHGFDFYKAMDLLLGSTPLSGANRTGTSTQNRKQKYSLTASEEVLDNSNDDEEPIDRGDKGKKKVVELAGDSSDADDTLPPPPPPPLPPRPANPPILSNSSARAKTAPSAAKKPFTSDATIPKPTNTSSSKPSGSYKPPVNLASSLKLVTENSTLKTQALIEKENRKDARADARADALVEAARIKREALHPPPPQRYQPQAMARFKEHSQEKFPAVSDRMAAAKILRNEENAEFFLELEDDLCFAYLQETIDEEKKKDQNQ
ncbi:uncharacterized protein MELLADRAFT_55795 [Melampsora larici-populina 98AG31]|uniref:Myb/SANT-like domain-containing protein n=1 Tax=Melampsora larici-populina (strain 98AG31 / pathotype 3-4-7) TaxID=747676 RepID=F4RIK2_MELLP|nr:uncharacterized protein MELLADRAFT_55795 [Melampsora larici-populina 98AG31]EGG07822.1 hypothetical protein MELLADRAFT_55795 [Melampsora larici-populina 98AG31]